MIHLVISFVLAVIGIFLLIRFAKAAFHGFAWLLLHSVDKLGWIATAAIVYVAGYWMVR